MADAPKARTPAWFSLSLPRTLARVRQFFAPGKQQLRRIELSIESLKHRLELAQTEFDDEEAFARFVAAR